MPLIVTLSEVRDLERRGDKHQFESIRWMEITSALKRLSKNGTKPVTQIEFHGEEVIMTTVMQWRKKVLGAPA
jgi:hypothetical protein